MISRPSNPIFPTLLGRFYVLSVDPCIGPKPGQWQVAALAAISNTTHVLSDDADDFIEHFNPILIQTSMERAPTDGKNVKPEVRDSIGLGDRTEDYVDIVEDRKLKGGAICGNLQFTMASRENM